MTIYDDRNIENPITPVEPRTQEKINSIYEDIKEISRRFSTPILLTREKDTPRITPEMSLLFQMAAVGDCEHLRRMSDLFCEVPPTSMRSQLKIFKPRVETDQEFNVTWDLDYQEFVNRTSELVIIDAVSDVEEDDASDC
jgi:hypothetical protein